MSSKMHKSELLKAARNFRVPSSQTDDSIYRFLSSIDTPRALTIWLLYKNKEHDQLTQLECHPYHYQTGFRFRLDYAATNFLSKASFLKTSFNREAVAFSKFSQYEKLCGITNYRFRHPEFDPLNNGSNVWLLNAVKRKISQVLGDFCGDELCDSANWGPGVSTLVKGEEVSGYNKFRDERGITRDLYSLVSPWFSVAYPSWHEFLTRESGGDYFCPQVGNSIVTVPKNSKTDRVIAIEPGFNLWFQKAVGSMIRRRLLRVGIDLNSQVRNQQLAKLGSETRSLATVDFSSASDSIALELVREILPPRWFSLMDACRSKVGRGKDGSVVRWNKFSSMGNGFTFELESLIFFCAAQAVQEYTGDTSPISVFGDDVIIGTDSYPLFSSFSDFLGFKVNESKSFSTGDFRESCGMHYYGGIDCQPVFLKERLSNVESIYKLANGIRNLSHRNGFNRYCDARFLDCWSSLYIRVPEALRFKVPRSAGDTGFISNFDEACPTRARNGIEGYYYRALASVGITRQGDGHALILARLRNGSIQEYNNSYTLRGRAKRQVTLSLVPLWYNLGSWQN